MMTALIKLLVFLISLLIIVDSIQTETPKLQALSQELIDYVNNLPNCTWRAGKSKQFKTIKDAIIRLGVKPQSTNPRNSSLPIRKLNGQQILPDSFDARDEWPNCPSIKQIRDQANCGSCWAFGAVETMTDRICIHSDAEIQVQLSARNLMSCCTDCGDGCGGGYPPMAWEYWIQTGIVSGGSYENPTGCQPYPFPSCQHYDENGLEPCEGQAQTPKCQNQCVPGSNMTYDEDKYYGSNAYQLYPNETNIMEELLTRGPIDVVFNVFEDFFNYQSGVYVHKTGNWVGLHGVKLIGWGEEQGIKYWTLANSWNAYWGEHGFFRMLRGVDECGIESSAVAGMPKY